MNFEIAFHSLTSRILQLRLDYLFERLFLFGAIILHLVFIHVACDVCHLVLIDFSKQTLLFGFEQTHYVNPLFLS